jgi:hypothetical protein
MGWPSAILTSVAASLPMLMFARLDIADRTGAVLLASGSGARAPEKPGDPYGCRVCGAPLPDAEPGAIVVRCGYCNANSVLGIDLRTEAGAARWQEGSFASAAAHRRRGEIWRAVSLVLAALLLVFAWRFRGVTPTAPAPDTYACLHGDDAACVAYCRAEPNYPCLQLVQTLAHRKAYDRVVRLWKTQCVADQNTLACDNAYQALLANGHVPRDIPGLRALMIAACDAGVSDECGRESTIDPGGIHDEPLDYR